MFYARYVELCAKKKVSPSKVALECGFNKGSVSVWKKKYEKGEDIKPTPETLVKIAAYFNVSVGYLLGIEDDYINEGMEKRLEKTAEDIALIAKEVISLLADKKCTINEADNVLRITKMSIDSTAMVRKLEY